LQKKFVSVVKYFVNIAGKLFMHFVNSLNDTCIQYCKSMKKLLLKTFIH